MAKNYLLIENSTVRKLSSFKFPPFTIFCCESKVSLDCLEPIVCNKTRFNFNVDFYESIFQREVVKKGIVRSTELVWDISYHFSVRKR